jgi:Zn-dependent M28 family amino/carboxypeptidase
MKLGLVAVVALTACSTGNAAPAAAVAPSCVDDGKPYDTKLLGDRIAFLASPELAGRAPGTDGDRTARAHIAERMRCLGLTPAGDSGTFEQAFEDGAKNKTANLIGFIKGTDAKVGDEIIVIGAHHDHLGDKHLGANDNASGIAAMLAIAQWVKQRDTAPKRTLAFMAFGAEEQGMVGSSFYVKHPSPALPIAKVVQVINLDMVGSYNSKKYVAAMGTFTGMPSRKLLGKLDDAYKIKVGVGGRARGSDYEPFCDVGIPYVFFWTPDARCYHESCDTAEAIDLPHTADIAALAGDLTWAMSETDIDLMASRKKLRCYGKK